MASDHKSAALYRMVMPGHVCPYGLKSRDLLERRGFAAEDHHILSWEQTDAFKDEHGVSTTPQMFIDGVRIGEFDDQGSEVELVRFRHDPPDPRLRVVCRHKHVHPQSKSSRISRASRPCS